MSDRIHTFWGRRYRALYEHLKGTTFFKDPASARYHCNYEGGLYEHSLNVENELHYLTNNLKLEWSDPESPFIIGLAHDVCKIGAYIPNGSGGYVYNINQPDGHGDLSVKRVKEWIELTEEEEACIRWHMGPYVDGDVLDEGKKAIQEQWNGYNEAIHRFPNVLFTHTADMMATHIVEVDK